MSADRTPQISVMLPCLNEVATVGSCVRQALEGIQRSGLSGEVLVVDNGSTDGSAQAAEEAGARVVPEAHRGYGSAYLRGFVEARGQYIVMADADGTYDLANLAVLVDRLREGYDLVMGNRLADPATGAMPWLHRRVGTPAISWLLRRAYGVRVRDSQSGFRGVTRRALERMDLRSSGMELASEMIVKAASHRLRVAEVPTSYRARVGESKLRTFRDGWRHLRLLLLFAPTYLFIAPGLLLTALGVLTFAAAFAVSSGLEVGGLTWQPVFAGPIFLVLGVNALALGFIARNRLVLRGLGRDAAWLRLYRRVATLELLLFAAVVAVLAGIGIDLVIFVRWVTSAPPLAAGTQLAALAQSLIIIGANLGVISFFAEVPDT